MTTIHGLTNQQVVERRQQGQGNNFELATSRPVKDILLKNVFNPVNIVLYVIGAGMLMVGDFKSAFATVMLVFFNSAVGIFQEVRSKKQLDQIALLARAKISVRRDGSEQKVDPSELVLGDILVVRAGDQVPVDGVVGEGKLEVDESSLTGESDLVSKSMGDEILSGTICMTGEALLEATGLGENSFANKLTKDAREFNLEITPLQRNVNQLLRVLLLIVIFFSLLAVLALFVLDLRVDLWLQILAVITGSVSAGLLTLITLNYSWGAVRIGQKGGLVQQINAIESLSHVTVLCTDKTGTLTANRIEYYDTYSIELPKEEVERLLADFAASASAVNKTTEAILHGLPGTARETSDEVPFSSARKWSAVAFDDRGLNEDRPLRGAYILGALEMVEQKLTINDAALHQLKEWSSQGKRVLVFARNSDVTTLHEASAAEDEPAPVLPPLTLLGVVCFVDELRPHLQETIAAFSENGVNLKVISGDNPQTVAALARQAGMPGNLKAVSGPELAEMSPVEFEQTAVEATVFGRITPQQKEALVDALRSRGEYVAMMGDGVNDVLSLKKANLGIAMESGSTATRGVAAMILLGDSFEVLPDAFTEGQRIVNSIHDIMKLFMATVFALLLLITGISFLNIGFPFTLLQSSMLSFFARGAPPFVLALVATAGRQSNSLLRNIIHFTLPASLLIFVFGLVIYIGVYFAADKGLAEVQITQEQIIELGRHTGRDYADLSLDEFEDLVRVTSAQTALTGFFVLVGVLLMVFAQPPIPWLAGGGDYKRGQWLPVVVAAILIVAYGVLLTLPGFRQIFDLVELPVSIYAIVLVLTIIWALVVRFFWRNRLLERFLDYDTSPAG